MPISKSASILLAGLFASVSVAVADGPANSIGTTQLQAAIASFGVPAAQSGKAAAAAVEQIAQKQREADTKTNSTVSLIPDDFLDISPY